MRFKRLICPVCGSKSWRIKKSYFGMPRPCTKDCLDRLERAFNHQVATWQIAPPAVKNLQSAVNNILKSFDMETVMYEDLVLFLYSSKLEYKQRITKFFETFGVKYDNSRKAD